MILPYQKHAQVDAVLARIGDDTAVPEGEAPYDSEEDTSASEQDPDENESDEQIEAAVADSAEALVVDSAEAAVVASADTETAEADRAAVRALSADDAESLAQSQRLIATLKEATENLRACGAMQAVVNLVRSPERKSGGCG